MLLALSILAWFSASVNDVAVVESGGLSVSVDMITGSYTLSVAPPPSNESSSSSQLWLSSSPPTYAGQDLVLSTSFHGAGAGVVRTGANITLHWSLKSSGAASPPVLATTVATSSSSSPASTSARSEELLLFTQTYLLGIKNTTVLFNNTAPATRVGIALGAFPSWAVPAAAAAGPSLSASADASSKLTAADLNYFTINGCQLQYGGFGKWSKARAGGGQQSMPFVWYARNGRAVAQGPASDFFVAVHQSVPTATATAASAGTAIAAGPMASLDSIAAGYTYTTVVSGSTGVQGAMDAYGGELLRRSGKTSVSVATGGSYVLAHLGYWVDNGAAYYRYYQSAYAQSNGMEACGKSKNCTREDALLAVQKDATARGIPLRYYQWDDWAPLNWAWPPSAFQDGASHWLGNDPYNITRPIPLSLYNGEWGAGANVPALKEKYSWSCVTNNGRSGESCVATDAAFFKDILRNGSKAGMAMFEQDYICSTTATTAQDKDAGAKWFEALDAAAAAAQVDVQLCMMNPSHALASTLMHTASNGRGTGDHVVRNADRALPLGWSGMLLWSVGMWPSRDNVWTNSTVNITETVNVETAPALQTALAVLAGGPYGPADIAGAMNKSLVMRACRSDGVMLRADTPALAIEQTWQASFDDLQPRHVWSSRVTLGAEGSAKNASDNGAAGTTGAGSSSAPGLQFTYILGLNMVSPFAVDLAKLDPEGAIVKAGGAGAGGQSGWIAFEGWHGIANNELQHIAPPSPSLRYSSSSSPSSSLSPSSSPQSDDGLTDPAAAGTLFLPACPEISSLTLGSTLWTVVPILSSGAWALLGEPDKIVKVSARRFTAVSTASGGVDVDILLAVGETVTVAMYAVASRKVVLVTCIAAPGDPTQAAVAYSDVDIKKRISCKSESCTCSAD